MLIRLLLFFSAPFLFIPQADVDTFIYYSSEANTSGRDIYKLHALNGKKTKLTINNGNGHYPHHINPKLSPDKKKLVFQSDPDRHDRYSIWTMNIDGSHPKRITQQEGMYPNWSPDGKTIIFSGRREGIWEIITISAQGGEEVILSQNKALGKRPGWGATCSYNPNGQSIIYSHIREKVLYKMDLKDKKTTRLSSPGEYYTHPVFSKDGSKIAVNRKITDSYDLVLFSPIGKKTVVVAKEVVSYSAPAWSPSGEELLFTGMVNNNQEIFKINLTSKKETQLTDNTAFDAMPTW